MSFTDKLENLMKANGISNKSELSRLSGIPYTTIDGFYKKGSDNIKLSTLKKLSECLHCSLDFLVDDVNEEPVTIAAHFDGDEYTEEELNTIREFAAFVKATRKSYNTAASGNITPVVPTEPLVNAAHAIPGASEEDKGHDEAIMNDDSEWK